MYIYETECKNFKIANILNYVTCQVIGFVNSSWPCVVQLRRKMFLLPTLLVSVQFITV